MEKSRFELSALSLFCPVCQSISASLNTHGYAHIDAQMSTRSDTLRHIQTVSHAHTSLNAEVICNSRAAHNCG